MSHNPKEAEKEMEKAIFISADCWLGVFDLLSPSQLGLGIAMISARFDYFVDEHFKTRKWKLKPIVIRHKIGENGAKEMEIRNPNGKLPMPQNPLPNKVIGFRGISIVFIDQNVITFLGHFHRFFATCATKLTIATENVRNAKLVVLNIWALFKNTIRVMTLNPIVFRQMRQLAPSMLNDFPCLRVVTFYGPIYIEFPPDDDSANASDGQAVTKWLFTPRHDNLTKELTIYSAYSPMEQQWLAAVDQIKAAFSNASSPVAFHIAVYFPSSSSLLSSVVPFELTNELTEEKLALAKEHAEEEFGDEDLSGFCLIRCPIVPPDDKRQQQQMINAFDKQLNRIDIWIEDDRFGDGLLDGSPGPSGDQ